MAASLDPPASEVSLPEVFERAERRSARERSVTLSTAGAYRMLRLDEIEPNPHNVRRNLTGIRELSESIAQHGLLENLVVTALPDSARRATLVNGALTLGPVYQLEAGSRRYAALQQLTDAGRRSPEEPVMCLVINAEGFWANLVENVQRTDVYPWDIGRRLHEAECGGLTHRAIAQQLGRSQGWVSRHITISRGLHPASVDFILTRKLYPKILQADLYRISALLTPRGDPDEKAQIAALERAQCRKRRPTARRYTADHVKALGARLCYLRTQMRIPPTIRPVVAAVLDYIERGGRIDLNTLEMQMLDAKRQFGEALDKD